MSGTEGLLFFLFLNVLVPASGTAQAPVDLSEQAKDPSLVQYLSEYQEKSSDSTKALPEVVFPLGTKPSQDEKSVQDLATQVEETCLSPEKTLESAETEGEEALGKILSACKEEMMLTLSSDFDSCTDAQKVVCAYDNVYHIERYTINVQTTNPIVVKTYNLQPYNGSRADTVIYLVYLPDGWTAYGDIVAIDDDGNTETPCSQDYPNYPYSCWDSKISYTPSRTGYYMVVVANYYQGTHGTTDISISYDGTGPWVYTSRFFGGYHITSKEVRTNDILLVGKNTNWAGMPEFPEYHDSMIFYFTTMALTCSTGSCGKMLFNDDALGGRVLLSRVDVRSGYTSTNGRILIGVWDRITSSGNPYRMNARFIHIRRHLQKGGSWSGAAQEDRDGDGLTYEVEQAIGSCDRASDTPSGGVGVVDMGCSDFGALINARVNQTYPGLCPSVPGDQAPDYKCWSPKDSDNDGLLDDWEVWAVAVKKASGAPTGPYYACDDCVLIHLLDSQGCPPGYYCVALPLSALSDPDPRRYDVYFHSDYFQCTGATCGGAHSHQVTSEQQGLLPEIWSIDPVTCWDGVFHPEGCPHPNDLMYLVQMHLYNGKGFPLPDDSAGDYHVPMGIGGTASYFNHSMPADKKYTPVFRYSLATHLGGGQSSRFSRRIIWGNDHKEAVTRYFSHEAGHTLSLDDVEPNDCDLQGQCPEAFNRCVSEHCADGREKAWGQNPNYASLMNYMFGPAGMRPKWAAPPSSSTPAYQDCSAEHLRFSKGLNPVLDESYLVETYSLGLLVGKLINDLFCLDDLNFCGLDNPYHPYCENGVCYVDWDSRRTHEPPPPPPYSFDVSYGRFCAHHPDWCCPQNNCSGTDYCAQDQLIDYNDWLAIIALGKQGLGPNKTWVRNFAIYQDPLNGAIGNYAGWPSTELPIYNSTTFADLMYPHNVCTSREDCKQGEACVVDMCFTSNDCLNHTQCYYGVCRCYSDLDCRGAHCDTATGLCDLGYGACSCSNESDCPYDIDGFKDCSNEDICLTWYDSKHARGSPMKSAVFRGPGYGQYIWLKSKGVTSPIYTVRDHNSFEIRFDFSPGTIPQGTTRSTLVRSNGFKAEVVKCGQNLCLEFTIPNLHTLVYPSQGTGNYLRTGQWYRVLWGVSKDSGHFVFVQPWDYLNGGYTSSGGGCVYKDFNATLVDPGDVLIGWDGQNESSRVVGVVDSINFWNYIRDGKPEGCVKVN